ncbi:PEP-CTERM sorting domain-containing protein [Colwellia sp. MB3u-70]|uniref:PEP-CTERM sorting domain-containing protein n=1 Tax=unclassified Colwellia TaxID=196834 RepID=UPI0015F5C92C|nr:MULTISPECIES: PEP-CTERM sorting domain-containing protein [unclassified Colwellia]MBA6294049.1 PEP-CTERM sorting domain-containing protein [Colwellia sp. MB3u-8]MBA6307590.1 PEP-CTERM sorting domain-containing protein [Colwellia sp. MB3u-70]
MFNLRKKLGITTLLTLTLGLVGSSQADIILDDFSYSPVVNIEVNSGSTSETTERVDINALGGDVIYTLIYNDGQLDSSSTSIDFGGDDALTWNNAVTMLSTLSLFYTDANANGTPSGPLDLTASGNQNSFYYDIIFSDVGFDISIIVGSGGFDFGARHSLDESAYSSTSASVSSLTRTTLSFSDFNAVSGSGADFASVDYVHVLLSTNTAGADMMITEFGTVPEPTSLAIFALGLIGLAFGARKKT